MKKRITIELPIDTVEAMDKARTSKYFSRTTYIRSLIDADAGNVPFAKRLLRRDASDLEVGVEIFDSKTSRRGRIEKVTTANVTINGVEHDKGSFSPENKRFYVIE